ncbi:MAG TPA: sigma-70 family RNA polymerase sigma factor [Candidatus Angelobacter sp.]|nr:sigma-70 family RNA polymerase sigma factor [Candidatus Angelobacter sp.]
MSTAAEPGVILEHLFRHQAGRMVAHLTRLLGPAYLTVAEEAVQEAMLRALQTWPYQGVPENPAGWLFRVAHNSAIDAVRRNKIFGDKTDAMVVELSRAATVLPNDPGIEEKLRDDELRMIFMCCHPAIPHESSVALSLKTVGGFNVREIARAFLADDATIAQRLVRAKRLIREQGLTLDMPHGAELQQRLDAVSEVIYFMFNEGYAALEGESLIRQDLCQEALRLGLLIASSSIVTPSIHALVALMALQAARLSARTDDAGDIVLLESQDRARWNQRLIALGFHHFDRSMSGDHVSEYHVQAAIAATHARAQSGSVDWHTILELYDQLIAIKNSSVIALNRAVAVRKVYGAAQALAAIEPLDRSPDLRNYHLLLAVRGQFLLDLGRNNEAADCYHEALQCRCSEPERRFLQRKLAECGSHA